MVCWLFNVSTFLVNFILKTNLPVGCQDNVGDNDVLASDCYSEAKPEALDTHVVLETKEAGQWHAKSIIADKSGDTGPELFSKGAHNTRVDSVDRVEDEVR